MKRRNILISILLFILLSTFCVVGCGATEKVTVTFKQDGEVDIVKTITKGDGLSESEIPKPKQIEGYVVSWDVSDFSSITKDITVNAVANPLYLTVTFVQEGFDDIVKQVRWGEDLEDVPTPQNEDGYTISWRITDFRRIKENLTVTTVKVGKTYTITFNPNGGSMANLSMNVEFGSIITLPIPVLNGYSFKKWIITETGERLRNGVYDIAKNISVTAVWEAGEWTDGWV